ncbi:hypothetical protein TrST_g10782 [Triparma strigata]|nr:hypothetical protein TrST_g10782 [Triparma strigata]
MRNMEYAVRGKVVITADSITSSLKTNPSAYPFSKIIYTNIGNPHSVGQKPLTWPRQVMALVDLPDDVGVDNPNVSKLFPQDAVERAKELKSYMGGCGTGAYSHSQGIRGIREEVAEFIEKRDGGIKCNPDDLFLTNGASTGIGHILTACISGPSDGVMIPIPQYPIYSASLALLGGKQVGYYLDENKEWSASIEELERSLKEAKKNGVNVRAFVLINPGNPTGQVLSSSAISSVIKFCSKHSLILLADEVYQENVYDPNKTFISCKKAATEAGMLGKFEMVSFHSTSKGIFGECGRRGGYMELTGFDPDVQAQIYKLASSGLCSGIPGQVMTSLMVKGPKPGDVSYDSHENEKKTIFDSLKRRAVMVSEGLNSIEGFECNAAEGSMYLFPKVDMPEKAIQEAKKQGTNVDTLYSLSLLEATGICVVPAAGFGQEPGRAGFRTTFLPQEEEMKQAVELFKSHHEQFLEKYK